MSERSIAEIIGWERHEISWPVENRSSPGYDADPNVPYRNESHGVWWPPGVSYSDGSPPNVDDILAWLTKQDRFVRLECRGDWFQEDRPLITVTIVQGATTRSHLQLHADTLLETLEWAVRKIDKENTDG